MENYKTRPDALIAIEAQEGSEGAAKELYIRFWGHSYLLAQQILERFNDKRIVDIADLVSIGLFSLAIAIKNYSQDYKSEKVIDEEYEYPPFYPYWKIIAKRKMFEEIDAALDRARNITFMASQEMTKFRGLNFSNIDEVKDNFVLEEIKDFLMDHVEEITTRDRRIFLDYINGYSYSELSRKYGLAYTTVKRRVEKIRAMIYDNLFKAD